jgi:hypothetical protein
MTSLSVLIEASLEHNTRKSISTTPTSNEHAEAIVSRPSLGIFNGRLQQ